MKQETSREAKRRKWAELLERQSRSGQSMRKFCDDEGVNYNTFIWWRQNLRKRRDAFREIELPVRSAPGSRYTVLFPNGRELGIEGGFAEGEAAALIRLVAAC